VDIKRIGAGSGITATNAAVALRKLMILDRLSFHRQGFRLHDGREHLRVDAGPVQIHGGHPVGGTFSAPPLSTRRRFLMSQCPRDNRRRHDHRCADRDPGNTTVLSFKRRCGQVTLNANATQTVSSPGDFHLHDPGNLSIAPPA